jgi:hypothetical protein
MDRRKNVFSFGATGTVLTQTLQNTGWIEMIIIDIANFSNVVTATVTINDPDGYEVYNSTALAKNTVTKQGDSFGAADVGAIPIHYDDFTMTVTISGVAGGTGGDVKVISFIKPTKAY